MQGGGVLCMDQICPRTLRVREAGNYPAWEHGNSLHPRGVACSPRPVGLLCADWDHNRSNSHHWEGCSLSGRARPCLLPWCSGSQSIPLLSVGISKKKVTGKGEKQNRKKISQSRNRNIPLGNHHGNREVTSPEESGMKQPNTLRT